MKTIYLAGGMKSNWQDRVKVAAPRHHYLDPRSHGLIEERDYTRWDLDAIRASSLVLAYMDTRNPSGYGLSLEVGFAAAHGKHIWYVCEDSSPRQRYFGMVRSVATRRFDSLDEAIERLKTYGQSVACEI